MQGDAVPVKKAQKLSIESEKDADTMALERSLSDLLGMRVGLVFKTDGSGEVKIRYQTLEQLMISAGDYSSNFCCFYG